jgi:hypothetical protein
MVSLRIAGAPPAASMPSVPHPSVMVRHARRHALQAQRIGDGRRLHRAELLAEAGPLFPPRRRPVSSPADMANVWFVQRVGSEWKKTGEQPAFQRPLGELIFKVDLGPQRRLAASGAPQPAEGTVEGRIEDAKTYVEVTEDDLRDNHFGGYFPGWYDSPYSAAEVTRRLG